MSKRKNKYNDSYGNINLYDSKPDNISFDGDDTMVDFAMQEKSRNASRFAKRAQGKKNRDHNKFAHEMALYGDYDY